MAIEDLDLEFENEASKASGDALDAGVDISFSANDQKARSAKAKPIARQRPANSNTNSQNVTPIGQAKGQKVQGQRVGAVADNSAEILELRREIELLKSERDNSQKEAEIKLAVSEAEKEYLIDYISNAKLLNHQVGQILGRIHKKVPALAAEVGAVQKYLQSFLESARPKKKD